MRDILILWIIFQLVFIGMARVEIQNQIFSKIYVCEPTQTFHIWLGAVLPLTAFVQTPNSVINYCNKITSPKPLD